MCSSRAPRSVCAAPTWASTLRMRSVAAIANTPSANVSNRPVVILFCYRLRDSAASSAATGPFCRAFSRRYCTFSNLILPPMGSL